MSKVPIRTDLDSKSGEMLNFIKSWLNTQYNTEAVKFCIKQTHDNLKSGKEPIRDDTLDIVDQRDYQTIAKFLGTDNYSFIMSFALTKAREYIETIESKNL